MKLQIERLTFDFSSEWDAIKWDDEPAFLSGIRKLQGSKAVDLVAKSDRYVALVEVKDFRHPDADWRRVTTRELADEVAFKVRDSVAGIIAAARKSPSDWRQWAEHLHAGPPLRLVLWFERPPDFYDDPRRKDELQHFRDALKHRLSWLTSDVFICSMGEQNRLPGISASGGSPGS